jgi:hypothetical protein
MQVTKNEHLKIFKCIPVEIKPLTNAAASVSKNDQNGDMCVIGNN